MNHRLTCGLAALCLFAFLPRASALTITQTKTYDFNSLASGSSSINVGGSWSHEPFDTGLGLLQFATLHLVLTATVTATDYNFYTPNPFSPPVPVVLTPIAQAVLSGGVGWVGGSETQTISGPAELIQPYAMSRLVAPMNVQLTLIASDKPSLDYLTGPSTSSFAGASFRGSTTWGDLRTAGNITSTLTYHYTVSEVGMTLPMISGALILIVAIHRRRSIVFPR